MFYRDRCGLSKQDAGRSADKQPFGILHGGASVVLAGPSAVTQQTWYRLSEEIFVGQEISANHPAGQFGLCNGNGKPAAWEKIRV
jgi:hypothetical protein